MLSCVLKSKQARQVNIAIIRVFTRMRKMLETNQELFQKLEIMEQNILQNHENIQELWFEIKKMIVEDDDERKIGFRVVAE